MCRCNLFQISKIFSILWYICIIILINLWQLNLFQWKHVEPFFRYIKRYMWAVKTQSHKKWFFVLLFKFFYAPLSHFIIRHIFISFRICAPVPKWMTNKIIYFLFRCRTKASRTEILPCRSKNLLIHFIMK